MDTLYSYKGIFCANENERTSASCNDMDEFQKLNVNNRKSKLGKEYVKAVYCHPVYLTSMQSTS